MSLRKTLLLFSLLSCVTVFAQQEGILPGEPDPNSGPGRDKALLDDAHGCPKGEKRYPKMKCGTPGDEPKCENYAPVLECRKKARVIHCSKPEVAVPVYQCE